MKPVVFPSLTSSVTFQARGESYSLASIARSDLMSSTICSVLEYLAREDAERAVKDLDGKDLRGQPVRVALSDDVCVPILLSSCRLLIVVLEGC